MGLGFFCFEQLQKLKVYFTVTFSFLVSRSNYKNLRFYFIFFFKGLLGIDFKLSEVPFLI